ncbi:hypothetical protein KEJ51_06205 [Candidatus Bathyarchaeota archaeon]|nr:hypothetical protein [Candidatus Bathyarchaeota archaeon]MBS7628402.1 hypothetical protein [Candidatus Bathyarchaeota archaeon]
MRKKSAKPKIILDTKPLIKMFAKEEGWEDVQKIAFKIESDEVDAAISGNIKRSTIITCRRTVLTWLRD